MSLNYKMVDVPSYDVFIILIITWILYIILKLLYPAEFKINMSRPKIYYREFQARSTHFFSDYRILSGITIAFVWSVFIRLILPLFSNHPLKIHYIIFISLLYIFSVFLIQYVWGRLGKHYSFLSFMRFAYLNRFAYYASFILFILWSLRIHLLIKLLVFGIITMMFYISYLSAEWKLAKELSIKDYMNILYLCTLDMIPVGILIVLITSCL